jgi:CHASE3 domain sensor protein
MAKDRIFRRNSLSLIIGAGSAIALLVINVAITSRNIQKLKTYTREISQDYEIIGNLKNVVSLAKDAETGQRGFIITGKAVYLEPYNRASADIEAAVETLDRLTVEDAQQQAQIPELHDRIDRKLNELEQTIVLRQSNGFESG